MKNYKIPFIITLILLIVLGYFLYNQKQKTDELEKALKEIQEVSIKPFDSMEILSMKDSIFNLQKDNSPILFSGSTDLESIEGVVRQNQSMIIEGASALLDIESEDIINKYQLDDRVYLNVSEAMERLEGVSDFNAFNDKKLCRIAIRLVRRTKCNDKIKTLRDKLSNISIGGVEYKDGQLILNGPKSKRYFNEISKVNLLIKTYEVRRKDLCEVKNFCDQNYAILACMSQDKIHPSIYEAYSKCAEFYLDNSGTSLIALIKELSTSIKKYEESGFSDEAVVALFNSKLEEAKKAIEGEKETETEKKTKKDSITKKS